LEVAPGDDLGTNDSHEAILLLRRQAPLLAAQLANGIKTTLVGYMSRWRVLAFAAPGAPVDPLLTYLTYWWSAARHLEPLILGYWDGGRLMYAARTRRDFRAFDITEIAAQLREIVLLVN